MDFFVFKRKFILLFLSRSRSRLSPSLSLSLTPQRALCFSPVQVVIDIPSLPKIGPSDIIECRFGSNTSEAVVMDQKVTCALPDPVNIPSTPDKQGESS